jgi:MSHA biogenesis protein MshP
VSGSATRGRHRAGFSLVSAVFLLVVFTAAGAFMVRIAGVQRATSSFALLGPKAYHTARSAVEWTVHQALFAPASCPVGLTTTSSFNLTEGGLQGFRATVECTAEIHTQAGTPAIFYRITALGEYGSFGERDYVSRRLEVTITDA